MRAVFCGIGLLLALRPMAIACECAPPPSVAYSQTETIFLGTITEITRMRGEFVAEVRMRVDLSKHRVRRRQKESLLPCCESKVAVTTEA